MNVIVKPKKKNYCTDAALMNAICKSNYVKIDWRGYTKHLENYATHLEQLIKQLEK